MVTAIHFDVALQVIAEGVEATRMLAAQAADELWEHVGDEILATEGKGCGDFMDLAGAG